MKVDMLEPEGDLTSDVAADALRLLDPAEHEDADRLKLLTSIELHLVYDWAMREHLHASGDRVRRREKPAALTLLRRVAELSRQIDEAGADRDEAQARVVDLEEAHCG